MSFNFNTNFFNGFVTFITRPRNIVFLAIIALMVIMIILLMRGRKKQEKMRDEQQELVDEYAQVYSMLVIDKKKIRMKDADIPQEIKNDTPWYGRRAKVPIVKVKVGTRVMNMIADNEIFDLIPVRKEIKATVAGIYIVDVRGIRTTLEKKEQKRGFFGRLFGGGFGGFGR